MVQPDLDYDIMSYGAFYQVGLVPTPYPNENFEFSDGKVRIVGIVRDIRMQLTGTMPSTLHRTFGIGYPKCIFNMVQQRMVIGYTL